MARKNLPLKTIFNTILPISYKLWKESQDEIYNQLRDDLKTPWISTQHTIHSGMNLPFSILIVTILFISLSKSVSVGVSSYIYFSLLLIIIFLLFQSVLLNGKYERYTDEKFLELSNVSKNT